MENPNGPSQRWHPSNPGSTKSVYLLDGFHYTPLNKRAEPHMHARLVSSSCWHTCILQVAGGFRWVCSNERNNKKKAWNRHARLKMGNATSGNDALKDKTAESGASAKTDGSPGCFLQLTHMKTEQWGRDTHLLYVWACLRELCRTHIDPQLSTRKHGDRQFLKVWYLGNLSVFPPLCVCVCVTVCSEPCQQVCVCMCRGSFRQRQSV